MSESEEKNLSFANSQELEQYIGNFKSYAGPEVYDLGSVVGFLVACLDNLGESALEAELEDIGDYMSLEQIDILLKIANFSRKALDN